MLDLKDVWTEYNETGNDSIRERMILDCMPLVKYVVGKVAGAVSQADREELLQSGVFGLIDAIEKYDPTRDTKFETYAILRIRGAVIDELRSRDWVPRAKRKLAREVQTISMNIESSGRIPTVDDLAARMSVSRTEMQEILQETSFVAFISLEDDKGNPDESGDNNGRVSDSVADTTTACPSARIELEEQKYALATALAELPEQERLIITLHYYEEMRLKDIGEVFGVSESRISQVHGRALVLLRMGMQDVLGETA